MNERDRKKMEIEQAREEWKADWFDNNYPAILKSAQRALSQSAGDELFMKEDVYDEAIERLCEDLAQFSFKQALALAGRDPFDPWSIPKVARPDQAAIQRLKEIGRDAE